MRALVPDAVQDAGFGFDMPAPIGGWNARDNLAMMKKTDAIFLDNWFPGTTDVDVRAGSASFATVTVNEDIKTLMGVAKRDGTFKRFAATSGGIYDITAGGVSAVSSAATVGKWESVNLEVGGVSYLWCCAGDGANDSRYYQSTAGTWLNLNGGSVPAITGVTSNLISNVALFKYRLILCIKNSLSFWVGGLNAVAGAFTEFPLGAIFKKGGYLVATANWTIDAGDGADDRFVAITSEGEVAVYAGTDPSDTTAFALIGVYDIGKPTGKRCFVKLAGDLGVITEQGLWPLSKALGSSTVDHKIALTDKIQWAFNTYYKQFGTEYGWQACLLPKGPALLVNVPIGFERSYQFVMNTITGAWCRFTGWSAECMMTLDGKLYFASGHTVKEGWTGRKDVNAAITCGAATAFSYGPARARRKKINMVKPVMQATATVNVGLALDTDFETRRSITSQASFLQNLALWDSAIYDQAIWSGGQTMINRWRAIKHKPGKAFSLRVRIQVKDIDVSWSATDFIGEAGGLG